MEYKEFTLDFSLKNKVAVITGGASGIGFAIADAFAQKGANLLLVDLSDKTITVAEELSKKYNIKALGVVQNLSEDCADKLAKICVDNFGTVDILVNNAGVSFLGKAEELPANEWDIVMNVNVKTPFLLSQAFAKIMIAKKSGKILNLASQGGIIALENHIAYCASKAAIISLTKTCALEWGKYGINVNSISPTVILTEMGKNYWQGERAEEMLKKIPIQRFGYPEEVAGACVYLSSDAANLITGSNLVLDGGYTIA